MHDAGLLIRGTAGLGIAALISEGARRAGSLSGSGAVAATLVGAAAVTAGWSWGALLVGYFLVSSGLSRLGAEAKRRRTASVVEKSGARDARQVLANGGLFAALACVSNSLPLSASAAAGALAASTADTWATELGTLLSGTPLSLRTMRAVPPGTSGGVSAPGTLALFGGALAVALAAKWLGLPAAPLAVAAGGVAGAMADSVLGATIQERRWCPLCERQTERRVHDCGTRTTFAGGLSWLDNDAVNLASCAVGAVVATLVAARFANH